MAFRVDYLIRIAYCVSSIVDTRLAIRMPRGSVVVVVVEPFSRFNTLIRRRRCWKNLTQMLRFRLKNFIESKIFNFNHKSVMGAFFGDFLSGTTTSSCRDGMRRHSKVKRGRRSSSSSLGSHRMGIHRSIRSSPTQRPSSPSLPRHPSSPQHSRKRHA